MPTVLKIDRIQSIEAKNPRELATHFLENEELRDSHPLEVLDSESDSWIYGYFRRGLKPYLRRKDGGHDIDLSGRAVRRPRHATEDELAAQIRQRRQGF
jgi:hypothetical protein